MVMGLDAPISRISSNISHGLDAVSWNPSLSYNPDSPNDCQLQQGYQYCAQLTLPTPTATTTTTTTSTTTSSQQATSTGPNGEPTPLPIQTGMTPNCDKFYLVQSDDGCYDIAAANNIALSDFYAWNPALKGDCSGLYPSTTTTTTTTTTTPTTTTPGGIQTPTPTQSGMVSGCTAFYLVKSGDGCYDIAAAEGIALSDLYSWNPALNGDCSGLWPDYYLCVGRGGASPTTTTSTTTAAAAAAAAAPPGNATPTPTQTGMVSGCKSFYLVQSGDGCYDIATGHGITLDQFSSYNPAVGSDCAALWPGYYVCVGV